MVMPPGPAPGPPPPATQGEHGAVAGLTREKACQILQDGQVGGQPLTPAQRGLMEAVCSGQAVQRAAGGAVVVPRDWATMWDSASAGDDTFGERLSAEIAG